MAVFTGEYQHQIDEKNRIRIPAKLKEKLGNDYVVTKGSDKCLFVFTKDYFENTLTPKLEALPLSNTDGRTLARDIFSSTSEIEEDKQGRFVLEQFLLRHCQIQKNVVTLGVGKRIEIWSQENYDNYLKEKKSFDESLNQLASVGF